MGARGTGRKNISWSEKGPKSLGQGSNGTGKRGAQPNTGFSQKPQNQGGKRQRRNGGGRGAGDVPPVSSDEEDGDDAALKDSAVPAYEALLSSLKSTSGAFADIYSQRRNEELGGSGSEDEGGSDTGSDEADSEGDSENSEEDEEDDDDEDEDTDDEDGEEDDVDDEVEGDDLAERERLDLDEADGAGTTGSGEDGEEDGEEGDLYEHDDDDDDDDVGDTDTEEGGEGKGEGSGGGGVEAEGGGAAGGGRRKGKGGGGGGRVAREAVLSSDSEGEEERRGSNGHASSSGCRNMFEEHLECQLTDVQVAALAGGKSLPFKTSIPAAGPSGGKWVTDQTSLQEDTSPISSIRLKSSLQTHWLKLHGSSSTSPGFASPEQQQLFSLCASYKDVLHTNRPVPGGREDAEQRARELQDAYLMHVVNHIQLTRHRVLKNSAKLAPSANQEDGAGAGEAAEPSRDQGFTRPKVLLLCPLRSSALAVVQRLLAVAQPSQRVQVENKDRFLQEFSEEDSEDEEEEGKGGSKESKAEAKAEAKAKAAARAKPADHRALFGGNNDDHFRLGIKLTRKAIQLYSDFYSSDIIVASPIALVTRIEEMEGDSDKDVDFFSSIELVVLDSADVVYMQNWQHVLTVFEHLNRIPVKQHGADFMRIREWYLNGWAKHYRQTIIVSAFPNADINALFHRTCVNHAGKVKLRWEAPGVLSHVLPSVRQVFERVESPSVEGADEARFEYFVKHVYPRLRESLQSGILIFVRSYFDFVRVRNFLKSQDASFCLLSEYTSTSDVSRSRGRFFNGQRNMMVYTERAHFYHRLRIRGIKELFFYSLPEHCNFYAEMLNLLEGVEAPSCAVLFTPFDKLELERVVGCARAKKMLQSPTKTFMFC